MVARNRGDLISRREVDEVFTGIVAAAIREANSPKNVRRYPWRRKAARKREIEAFNLGLVHAMEAFYQAVGDVPRREPPQRLP